MPYIEHSKLLSTYCPRKSTKVGLIKVANDLLITLKKGNISKTALLDVSVVFDIEGHSILIRSLQRFLTQW